VRLQLAATAARAAGALSRRTGRGGTSLPGKVLLRLEPRAIGELAGRLGRGSAVISATNGKTTTAAMVAAILERGGHRLVHNRAGANMAGGVASALLQGRGDTGLFEVDEFWLEGIVRELGPDAILLANLFRDQLDRYGELEAIADRWAALAATTSSALVLNADDPLVADLGRTREDVTSFGVEDRAMALAGLQHAADSTHCRRCGAPYRYDAVFLGHLGHYHCDSCGQTRPVPQVAATQIALDGARGARFTLSTPAGQEAVALDARGWRVPGSTYAHDPAVAALISLSGGASVLYEGDWASRGPETSWNGEWEITGEEGTLTWTGGVANPHEGEVTLRREGEPERPLPLPNVPHVDRAGSLAAFRRAVETGEEPETSGRDNLGSLGIVLAMVEAIERAEALAATDRGIANG